MYQLLFIENAHGSCGCLSQSLPDKCYAVTTLASDSDVLGAVAENAYDVVVVDVSCGLFDGVALVGSIRERFSIPVVMLAQAQTPAEQAKYYVAGVDHLLCAPVECCELLARVDALLRRVAMERNTATGIGNTEPESSDSSAPVSLWLAFSPLPFTLTESELLQYLFDRHDTVVAKAELQLKVLKKELSPFDRNLDMHISNIRSKLRKGGFDGKHIKTVRGKGYSFIHDLPTSEV